MLCIMCRKTFPHGLTCMNCGYNYSNVATINSLFELDVTTINDTIAYETQSLNYDTLLDRIRLERAGVADREKMRLQQGGSNTVRTSPTSGYTRNRPIAFGVTSRVNQTNATVNYLDVETTNDTFAHKTQSLDYDTLLDRIRLERAGVADRERMRLQQGGSNTVRTSPMSGYTRYRPIVLGVPNPVDQDNTTSNYTEALTDVKNVIRNDSNNPYWYFLRAEINYSFGRTHLVRDDLIHAIKLSPHLVDYYVSKVKSMDKLSTNDITMIERVGRNYQKRYHNSFSDKIIVCKGCGQNFTITAELQIYFAEHGTEEPQYCEDCRSPHRKVIGFAYTNRN